MHILILYLENKGHKGHINYHHVIYDKKATTEL